MDILHIAYLEDTSLNKKCTFFYNIRMSCDLNKFITLYENQLICIHSEMGIATKRTNGIYLI